MTCEEECGHSAEQCSDTGQKCESLRERTAVGKGAEKGLRRKKEEISIPERNARVGKERNI